MIPFAEQLVARGFEIVATTSTGKSLREAGIEVIDIAEVTKIPEGMDGRLKTISPFVAGGILADRAKHSHLQYLADHGIHEIDLVVVNLYDFAGAVASGASLEETIEKVDIGGPSLLRAAAKNHQWCVPLCDPAEYDSYIKCYNASGGDIDQKFRLETALKVFKLTAAYDELVATYLHQQLEQLMQDRSQVMAEQGI